jgi:hypothetical protein
MSRYVRTAKRKVTNVSTAVRMVSFARSPLSRYQKCVFVSANTTPTPEIIHPGTDHPKLVEKYEFYELNPHLIGGVKAFQTALLDTQEVIAPEQPVVASPSIDPRSDLVLRSPLPPY